MAILILKRIDTLFFRTLMYLHINNSPSEKSMKLFEWDEIKYLVK